MSPYTSHEFLWHLNSPCDWNSFTQGCTNPGRQVSRTTKYCVVAPNICGCSLRNLLHVSLLAPIIFRWILDFLKICAPLVLLMCFVHSDSTNAMPTNTYALIASNLGFNVIRCFEKLLHGNHILLHAIISQLCCYTVCQCCVRANTIGDALICLGKLTFPIPRSSTLRSNWIYTTETIFVSDNHSVFEIFTHVSAFQCFGIWHNRHRKACELPTCCQ